jgi:hypothetical protein
MAAGGGAVLGRSFLRSKSLSPREPFFLNFHSPGGGIFHKTVDIVFPHPRVQSPSRKTFEVSRQKGNLEGFHFLGPFDRVAGFAFRVVEGSLLPTTGKTFVTPYDPGALFPQAPVVMAESVHGGFPRWIHRSWASSNNGPFYHGAKRGGRRFAADVGTGQNPALRGGPQSKGPDGEAFRRSALEPRSLVTVW